MDRKIVSSAEKRLTLSFEDISEFPQNLIKDFSQIIEILDLSNNKFKTLDFLKNFENLTTLILDHNQIGAEIKFPRVRSLETLWINHNCIDKLHPFIENCSRAFPQLKYLSLMGNSGAPSYFNGGTFYEYLQYRLFVISFLPTLEHLDDRSVTQDERDEAVRLFSRPFYQDLKNIKIPKYYQLTKDKLQVFKGKMTESSDSIRTKTNAFLQRTNKNNNVEQVELAASYSNQRNDVQLVNLQKKNQVI